MANKKIFLFLLLGIFMLSFTSAALTDNIISYYKLDETSGTTAYDSLFLNDGTNVGTATIGVSGKINNSYDFDGTTPDRVNIPDSASLTFSNTITISTWFNTDNAALTTQKIITKDGSGSNREMVLQIRNTGIEWDLWDTGDVIHKYTPSYSFSSSTWYYLVGTYDGSTMRLYVDGSEVGVGTSATFNIKNSNAAMIMGTDVGLSASAFDGKIDELGIWSRALNQSEITQLYNGNNGLTYPFVTGNDPQVTLNSPADSYVSNLSTIDFNVTVTDDLQVENVTLYIDGIANETNSSGFNGTYIFTKALSEGNHNWSILAYDNESRSTQSATRTLTIDTGLPLISIESPSGFVEYHILGENLTLNVTVNDSNLDTCWYEYNSTETIFSCSDGIKSSELFNSILGEQSLTVYANDTAANINSASTSWDYSFLETERVYNSVALQTDTETFVLAGIKDSGITSISATLTHNGDTYATLKTGSGNNANFTTVVGIPTDLSGAVDFYWTVTYINSTGTYSFNTTNSTQTIFALSLEECFAPSVDGLTLNFTTYDSTNLTALESTFEATFQFYAESGTGSMIVEYLFSDLNENRSNYMFCLNSSGQNVTLDAFISYDATNFDRREYILDDAIIGNFTQSIPLFLTETDLTDIVTITVQDQSYDPIAGALVNVQTWNVGTNTYSTIGMLTTSSSGQGIIDLELYTTWYRSVVSVGGEIVQVTDVQKLSGTSWIITVALEEDNPYDLFGDILHGLTFDNSTNITSFTWVDVSGYTQEGCMVIKNNTNLGPVTIFDSCVKSVSGTIDYLISGDGDYTAYGVILLEGYEASQIVDTLNIRLGTPAITETVSPFGKVITFLMVGVAGAIGVAAGSIILGSFLLIAVLFAALKFGFLNITSGFIWGIVSILLIAIFIQKRKRG